ncbi:MAG: hypothetical protein CSA81_14105 [Acidobacteria bacterium]|nr:MAG: hypothetical protein CSA81_14105 [Acidobacteriota bacterium]
MAREQPDSIGCVWSNDVDSKRLVVLQANLNRSGFAHSAVSKINGASFGNVFPETFDSILLDAPCSGEGTGYKSASAYERWSEKGVRDIANLQQSLLHSAAKACKVGGSIVYSTCTINHRENESQIKWLLETYPDAFEVEDVSMVNAENGLTHYQDEEMISPEVAKQCIRCRPHHQSTGGFFVVKFRKTRSIAKPYTFDKAHSKQNQFSTPLTHSRGQDRNIAKWLKESFGMDIDLNQYAFVTSAKKVFVTSPVIVPFLSKARFEKVGVPIAKVLTSKRTGDVSYIPLQHLANSLGHLATHHTIDITPEQAQAYSE